MKRFRYFTVRLRYGHKKGQIKKVNETEIFKQKFQFPLRCLIFLPGQDVSVGNTGISGVINYRYHYIERDLQEIF